MKKIFGALMIAICIAMTMPAQAQIHFGVKGGLNLSKASFSNVSENFKKDNFTGFFIGPMAEFNIPIVGLGVDASLLFAQRGIKVSEGNDDITVKQNGIDTYFSFLLINSRFLFKIEIKVRTCSQINTCQASQTNGIFQVGANYNIPLGNTADIEGTDASYKTKTWQVSVAYIF